MKITIESSTMTILVPPNTNLGLIIAELKKIFPNDEWKQYNLQPEFEVTYSYGIQSTPHTYTIPYYGSTSSGSISTVNPTINNAQGIAPSHWATSTTVNPNPIEAAYNRYRVRK